MLAEAELGWEDRRVVFIYADDEEAAKAFADAGWSTHSVEDLVERPDDFVDVLNGGSQA